MDDGIYQISLETPMGKMQGNLFLETKEGSVSGYIEAMGGKNYFQGGNYFNHRYEFEGKISYFLGSISYQAKVQIQGKNLIADVVSNFGNFKINGNKIER